MWDRILDHMLSGFVRVGTLEITFPDGTARRYGDGSDAAILLTLGAEDLPRRIVLNADLGLGEGYMDGTLVIADDDLEGLMALVLRNARLADGLWWRRLAFGVRRVRRGFDQWNPVPRARANVAHHYDLSGALYDLFLDRDRQYSCAYFEDPNATLEQAQAAKKAVIAAKLCLRPDMEVFEIGCGWGGLALSLARDHGVRVLGVTLSVEQHRVATERAREAGLSDRVRFELCDYRTVTGRFDRIVSVGMFEHVGVPHYGEYFRTLRDRLTEDGVALVHTIGRTSPPGTSSPWMTKYIFPGGYIPALSEVMAAIERTGLWPTDIEIWRLHYAMTLRHWHERFMARADEATRLFDARFVRMWRYYLTISEMAFRHDRQCVFQIQLTRRQDAVPLTRDYLFAG